jgi:two-component system, NarL family, nitrate/nitrite response regulator NarL
MLVAVVCPVCIFADGLSSHFAAMKPVEKVLTFPSLETFAIGCRSADIFAAVIDVSQGIDLDEMRAISVDHPNITLLAIGLPEQKQEVIRCGRAGFSGFVFRNSTRDELDSAFNDMLNGKLSCSAEVSQELLRSLFNSHGSQPQDTTRDALTNREAEVARLIARGLSNKEIARSLGLSAATVKNHVHHVLQKLQTARRNNVMQLVRKEPWLAAAGSSKSP